MKGKAGMVVGAWRQTSPPAPLPRGEGSPEGPLPPRLAPTPQQDVLYRIGMGRWRQVITRLGLH